MRLAKRDIWDEIFDRLQLISEKGINKKNLKERIRIICRIIYSRSLKIIIFSVARSILNILLWSAIKTLSDIKSGWN